MALVCKSNFQRTIKRGFYDSICESFQIQRNEFYPFGTRLAGCGRFFTLTNPGRSAHLLNEVSKSATSTALENHSKLKSVLESLKYYSKCYSELSKARLSFLVVSTASAGFVMGSGTSVDMAGLFTTSMGTLMAAASANSFNQIMEVKNDSNMNRTKRRPLPSGRLGKFHALAWAIGVGVSGITLLATQTNTLTAGLGAANIALYALVYTPLKQIHPINTWVGAVVGAIPPLMGWAAASGQLDPGAAVLAAGLYFWQMPHFMALAWLCRKDYASGGYKMLSLVDVSGKRTAGVALRNCLYLLPLGFAASFLGTTSELFAYENVFLTAGFAIGAIPFYKNPSPDSARKLFRYSLMYLPVIMTGMIIHRLPNPSTMNCKSESRLSKSEEIAFSQSAEGRLKEGKGKHQQTCIDWRGELVPRHAPLPPVAYMSAAPFPFLPLPEFSSKY